MNYKLQVIQINEDVISSSGVEVWGIAIFEYDLEELGGYVRQTAYKNGYRSTNPEGADPNKIEATEPSSTKPEGFVGNGVYHVDSLGNIIEKCTCDTTPFDGFDSIAHDIHTGE